MANALTTEELTDRGGGGAFHSARVEVEPVPARSPQPSTRQVIQRRSHEQEPTVQARAAGRRRARGGHGGGDRGHPSSNGVITALPRHRRRDDPGAAAGHRHGGDAHPGLRGRRGDDHLEPAGPAGPQGDPGPPGDSGSGTDTSAAASGTAAPAFDTSQTGGPSADIFLASTGSRATAPTPSTRTRSRSSRSPSWPSGRRSPPAPSAVRPAAGQGLRRVVSQDLAAATSGRHLKSATVTFSTGSDPSGTDVLTYKLSDVTVTSYEQGGANPDTKPLGSLEEEIGLRAARVSVSEKRLGAGGRASPPVTASGRCPGRPSARWRNQSSRGRGGRRRTTPRRPRGRGRPRSTAAAAGRRRASRRAGRAGRSRR